MSTMLKTLIIPTPTVIVQTLQMFIVIIVPIPRAKTIPAAILAAAEVVVMGIIMMISMMVKVILW